jgi:hypothetical protein
MPSAIVIRAFGLPTMIKLDQRPRNLPQDFECSYIQAAIDQLTPEGWDISQPDIAGVSPLLFKHINFLGRYAFDLPQAVAEGALRPLRNPTSE